MKNIRIRRALISVSDKTGIAEFARALNRMNIEILSTGGTMKTLSNEGIAVKAVSEVTGFPEILDGRVKTLHPKIHGGLLAIMDNESHLQQLEEHEIESIDLVVVNLYPFERTIADSKTTFEDAIEQIDIGGPTMLRSAAKNFSYKTVVVNPEHYKLILSELTENDGATTESTRLMLAEEAFRHTAFYDATISRYLLEKNPGKQSSLPATFLAGVRKDFDLRYGENPHQTASFYGNLDRTFEHLHGKELSYNNILDIHAAASLSEEFAEPSVIIIKHTNPCGVGSGATLAEAYEKAFATDKTSAFGGIVCVNRSLDMDSAKLIDAIFTEVIIAPEIPINVLEFLKRKKDRRLILQRQSVQKEQHIDIRSVAGGLLIQTTDEMLLNPGTMKVVTNRQPTTDEYAAMMFAWKIAKHVKSNAIIYARPDRTIGIGAGQMSRIDSSRVAGIKAQEAGLDLHGTAVASDAFFPFADGMLEAVKVGATAVIQPGGSIRDAEVIQAANEHNIAMMFTGTRHFKH